ncbi:MAG: hypothetical protein K6G31_04205 [Paludibacteraceae bacterium]|nr:hypothetical protein [Paludibacteraceae bacterium]
MLNLYDYATYTFMLTTFFCAVVRLFHVCRPFAQYADYFYPSRIETAILFFYSSVLQLPYFLCDNAEWSVRYIAIVLLLCFSSFYILLVVRYFITKPKKLVRGGLILLAMLPSLPYLVDGLLGGKYIFSHSSLVFYSSLIIGVFILGGFIYSMFRLFWKIRNFNLSNYSSEEDFPFKFAYIVFFVTGVSLLCFWINWIIESEMAIAITHIILSVLALSYLLIILHPQQPSSYQCVFPKDLTIFFAEKEETKGSFDMKKLARTIHQKVYDEKMYLNPHLSLIQLASEIGYGRTITSKVCNEYYGGFYKLVNDARLAHAKQLRKQHPEYTQETIARESGFSNRNSLMRVKKRIFDTKEDDTSKQ